MDEKNRGSSVFAAVGPLTLVSLWLQGAMRDVGGESWARL